MEAKAIGKFIKVQPRKVRIVADEIRGKSAFKAAGLLRYHTSKGARELRQVLISAMANAIENHGLPVENLKITKIMIDEGPRQKRMRARAQGRGNRILKKTAHITVVVEDQPIPAPVKPHGTKAKPRPTFAVPKKGKAKATKAKGAEAVVEEQAVTEKAVDSTEAIEAEATQAVEETKESEGTAEATEEAEASAPKDEQGEESN